MNKEQIKELIQECIEEAFGQRYGSPVASLGRLNLATGKSKYFNVYETWGGDGNSTAELWKARDPRNPDQWKNFVVFTSGSQPLHQPGDTTRFLHDQTGRPVFFDDSEMLEYVNIDDLQSKAKQWGRSLPAYTYK